MKQSFYLGVGEGLGWVLVVFTATKLLGIEIVIRAAH